MGEAGVVGGSLYSQLAAMHADPRAGQHTPIIEPLSLDEAYLDVTENLKAISSATQIAEEIRQESATKPSSASAGVSYNKSME